MIKLIKRFIRKYRNLCQCSEPTIYLLYLFGVLVTLPRVLMKRSLMPADRLIHKLLSEKLLRFKVDGKVVFWPGKFFSSAREFSVIRFILLCKASMSEKEILFLIWVPV